MLGLKRGCFHNSKRTVVLHSVFSEGGMESLEQRWRKHWLTEKEDAEISIQEDRLMVGREKGET